MTRQRLTSDLLNETSKWSLRVRIAPDSLSALLSGPEGADRSVIAMAEPLTDPSLPTLENAIYDNPLLLADFNRATIIVDTDQMAVLAGIENDALAINVAEDALLPDSEAPRAPLTMAIPDHKLIALLDSDTLNFLKRTFPDAKFEISLGVFANKTASLLPPEKDSLLAVCEPDRLFICACRADGKLTFANRFAISGPEDCAYYILAVAGLHAGKITLGGDHDLRNRTIDEIHRAEPSAEVNILSLPDPILNSLRQAPDLPLELFLTDLI